MRSVVRRGAWLGVVGVAIVVLGAAPAGALPRGQDEASPFRSTDTGYAVTNGASVVPGLLLWLAALAALLVVGVSVRWFQRSRS